MTDGSKEQVLTGKAVSGGVVLGTLRVVRRRTSHDRAAGDPAHEQAEFSNAIERARAELEAVIAAQDELAGEILEFQLALLDDDDLLAPAFAAIKAGTPWHETWAATMDREIAEYRTGDDDYMAARADDLADLKLRVLASTGEDPGQSWHKGDILVTDELTPSMFLQQDWGTLVGAAASGGSPTSHVAILARARGVNLVVGLTADLAELESGSAAILDGENGRLVVAPSQASIEQARIRQEEAGRESAMAESVLNREARTADGERVTILVNVDDPDGLEGLKPDICDGIGLTRTEFLFAGAKLPDEEAQYETYRRIVEWADGRPVTIRTLDAGGDKPIAGVTPDRETNPFLGVRGVRLSLRQEDMFATQLRALLRAAQHGSLKIMIPMVTAPSEMTDVRTLAAKARSELEARSVPYGEAEIGMMVEVPAAALTADLFDADFYSIGSNDLIQYTTASARDNPEVSDLADGANPAVLELISRTVETGRRLGREVSLCGDMASQPGHIEVLLRQGLTTLSVAPAMVGRVKLAVSRIKRDAESHG